MRQLNTQNAGSADVQPTGRTLHRSDSRRQVENVLRPWDSAWMMPDQAAQETQKHNLTFQNNTFERIVGGSMLALDVVLRAINPFGSVKSVPTDYLIGKRCKAACKFLKGPVTSTVDYFT